MKDELTLRMQWLACFAASYEGNISSLQPIISAALTLGLREGELEADELLYVGTFLRSVRESPVTVKLALRCLGDSGCWAELLALVTYDKGLAATTDSSTQLRHNFVLALAQDVRSWRPETLQKLASRSQSKKFVSQFSALLAEVEEAQRELEVTLPCVIVHVYVCGILLALALCEITYYSPHVSQKESTDLGDIPDEFMDPLLCSLMRDPVILPRYILNLSLFSSPVKLVSKLSLYPTVE
jgi:hypothetical protein